LKKVFIDGRDAGSEKDPYIIAEAGINHCGSLKKALAMAAAARSSGADAVKYQFYETGSFLSSKLTDRKIYGIFKKCELTREEKRSLLKGCQKAGISAVVTPLDLPDLELAVSFGASALKIASPDITFFPLLEAASGSGLPVILSTGASGAGDIEKALEALKKRGNPPVILLHCVPRYPAPLLELNLGAIGFLEKRFKLPSGFSDHAAGNSSMLLAFMAGAKCIEKHFMLDGDLDVPDRAVSITAAAFADAVGIIKNWKKIMGTSGLPLRSYFKEFNRVSRRSAFSSKKLPAGSVIGPEDVLYMRPGPGIAPGKPIIGKKLLKALDKGELISYNILE